MILLQLLKQSVYPPLLVHTMLCYVRVLLFLLLEELLQHRTHALVVTRPLLFVRSGGAV